jgi:iron(III) transport system ATP-binding protein
MSRTGKEVAGHPVAGHPVAGHPVAGHHVRVRGALKRYGSVVAISGVDLDVEPGRFVVLLGPSGSGKSTLIRSLAGIERLDGGTVHFDDALISDRRRHVPPDRRNLAMVFQDYALWPHLTVSGNVGYALRRRRLSTNETRRRTNEALARVGLSELAMRYPHELSGGEQQWVGLARAIVAQPALLLFDEPLSNLDADLRERLRMEISTITRDSGCTAIYITHDQSEAFALADEIGILQAGHLVQMGPPEEIYHRPATPFVARFTGVSGQLAGRATGRRGEHLLVRVGNSQIACRPVGEISSGASVEVLIRSAATSLRSVGGNPPPGTLRGTIVDIAYRGRGYDHVVDCGVGLLTSVFDINAWPRGSTCGLGLDPEGCSAFGANVGAVVPDIGVVAPAAAQVDPPAEVPAVLGAVGVHSSTPTGGSREQQSLA